MANEITSTYTLSLSNGDLKFSYAPGSDTINQTTAGKVETTLALTTSEQNVDLSALTSEGIVVIINLDATNNAIIGPQVGTGSLESLITLLPGENAHFRMTPGANLRAKSSAGTVRCHFIVLDA